MSEQDFRQLLLDWQRYVFLDHTLHGLGIAQSAYAERTGTSQSASDPLRNYDPEVILWHEFFCRELPATIKDPLHLCYLVPGPEKRKYGNKSSRDYYQILGFARETARMMFASHLDKQREAA